MKRVITIFAAIGFCIFTFACSDSGSGPQNQESTPWDAYRQVASTTARVISSGLSTVFSYSNTPEVGQKQILQIVLQRVRIFDDSSSCIMVFDTSMTCVANPFDTASVGKSYLDSVDARGKKYFKDLYETFLDFNLINISGKYYYQKIDGKEYPLGIYGRYINNTDLRMVCQYVPKGNPKWCTDSVELKREIVRNVVSAAVHGTESVFSAFVYDYSKQVLMLKLFTENPRFFDDNSGYLFVDDMNHISICFPTDKDKEGTSLYDYKDSRGNYPVRMMVSLLQSANCGWVEYYYTNPNTQKEQKKHVYVQRIEGTNMFIGAGCYE